jgi:predicted phosphodiesterase
LAGRRLAVTHGDSDRELRRLEAQEPHYLLTGHTHQVADRQSGSIRWINPGALHRASTWTVALLDLATNQLRVLPISNGTTPR